MADGLMTKNWRDLIKPRGLALDQDSLTDTYGKFVAEPLERGFGITLGNALRRVLLNSLQGAAIQRPRRGRRARVHHHLERRRRRHRHHPQPEGSPAPDAHAGRK